MWLLLLRPPIRFHRWDLWFGRGATSWKKNFRAFQEIRSGIWDYRAPRSPKRFAPLLAYTGDTSPAGLDNYPTVYEAKILITEMSFIRSKHRKEKIHKFGHMHLDDFVERAAMFKNELIVVGHQSTRYLRSEILKVSERKIPPELFSKMKIWV